MASLGWEVVPAIGHPGTTGRGHSATNTAHPTPDRRTALGPPTNGGPGDRESGSNTADGGH